MPTQGFARSVIAGPAIPAKSGVTLLARLRGQDGNLITRASLSTITYTVSELVAGATLGTGTFTISSVIFDSLQQNDARWSQDDAGNPGPDGTFGFNFAATLASTLFALDVLAEEPVLFSPVVRKMQADVVFTPVTGQAWRVTFLWTTPKTYG